MLCRRTPALRRALLPPVAAGVLIAASALPALAHVGVSSPDAVPGGFGKLVFRVPTESDTASTTTLQVTLPRHTPFAFVSSRPVPGWRVATTERRLDSPLKTEGFTLTKVVSTVTWTARKGAGIKPGQFDEFELSVGPFPTSSSALAMPATQTYSDGNVVTWDEPSAKGQPEPEHPAPTLELAAASSTSTTVESADSENADVKQASAPAADSSDNVGRWLGGAGLVIAMLALVLALARGRRPAGSA